jgi:hypothetical protein
MNKGLQDSITSFSLQLLSQQFLPYALNGLEADAVLIPEDAYVSILPQAPHDQQEQGVCSFALVHWQACSEAAPCVEDVQIIADAKTLWHAYEAQSLPPNLSLPGNVGGVPQFLNILVVECTNVIVLQIEKKVIVLQPWPIHCLFCIVWCRVRVLLGVRAVTARQRSGADGAAI